MISYMHFFMIIMVKAMVEETKEKVKNIFFLFLLSFFALVIAIVVILIGRGRGC